MLFLLESELGFLRYLKESKVPLNEYSFPVDKVANVQSQVTTTQTACVTTNSPAFQLEKLLQKNYFLHQSARDGYRSYLQSYASYSLKKIFNVDALDLAKVAKSFGFAVPPRVNVNIGGGTGGTGRLGKKRKHEDNGEDGVDVEEVEVNEDDLDNEEEGSRGESVRGRGGNTQSKNRRAETLGRKKVEKEVFRKGMQRKRQKGSQQWNR